MTPQTPAPPAAPPPGMPPPAPPPEAIPNFRAHICRFFLFAGPLVTDRTPVATVRAVAQAERGWSSFLECSDNLPYLLGRVAHDIDPDESWWHIVDLVNGQVLYSSDDVRTRH